MEESAIKTVLQACQSIKETTRRAYLADLNTIKKYCGDEDIGKIIMDPDTWYPVISKQAYELRKAKRKSATGTRRTLVKSILAVLKHTGLKQKEIEIFYKWHNIFQKLSKEVEEINDNNVQTISSMDWSSVIKCASEQKEGTLEHVTMMLYTAIPPRRQQDYWKLRVRGELEEGDTAFMNFKEKKLSVHIFKTGDKYGEWEKIVPDSLLNAVKSYLDKRMIDSDYLFCKQDGLPYASLFSFTSANNATIKRACQNPHASVNTLRHAAASHVHGDATMLRKDKKQFAYDMGHSFHMQSLYVEIKKDA